MTATRLLTSLLAAAALSGATASAQDAPVLRFPVECTLGDTCFLQQFVDRDAGPGARAFDCGPQSYDGHTGTDIRVADFEAMTDGVDVVAAADGVVQALRDGVPDGGTAMAPEGQGCGNGVVLTHPGGWTTQYCHLMQDSVAVTLGQSISAGTPLGLIGYSGHTDFPHVEFILRRDGVVIDPFDPSDLSQCGAGAAALWADPVPVAGGGLLSVGFADAVPEFDAIKTGTADAPRLDHDGAALILWGYAHGVRAGDTMILRISDGAGREIHAQAVSLDRTQAQIFRASGRRTPAGGWPPGQYRGEVTLIRDEAVLDQINAVIAVD
jgi:hypothetical protein